VYYVSFKAGVPVLNVLNNAYILFSIWLFVDLAKDTKRPCVSCYQIFSSNLFDVAGVFFEDPNNRILGIKFYSL